MKPAIPEKLPILHLNWTALLPILGEANRAIARFDGMLAHMPSADLLRTPLMTREAVLSSKIEGTVATLSDVFRFEAGEEPVEDYRRLDIEEIVNYRVALRRAQKELKIRPFSLNLVLKLHQVLMNSLRGHNKAPGEFRRIQNYLGRPGSTMAEATFIPPSPDRLMSGLDNWERYYHSDEKDALVQLALIHAQFEFLHPFLDGNGRIGRILIPLFLFDRKIFSSPTFYLSEYLEENREAYIDHLGALKDGGEAWDRWCLFFITGMATQAEWNVVRAQAILKLYERLKARMFAMTTSRSVVPLLDAMFAQPVFHAGAMLKVPGMLQRPQLMILLDRLVEGKVLRVLTPSRGRRPAIYSLHDLVKLCESRPKVGVDEITVAFMDSGNRCRSTNDKPQRNLRSVPRFRCGLHLTPCNAQAEGLMSRQILGTFQSRDVADSVKDALIAQGYAAGDMIVMANRQSDTPPEDAKLERGTEGEGGFAGFEEKVGKFVLGVMGERPVMEGDGSEGIGKDGALLAITVADDPAPVARVIELLKLHQASDIEESQPD